MPYKPVTELRGQRPRLVTIAEASAMLDGVLSPGTIRDLIRAGRVPGAVKGAHRYFLPRKVVPDLLVDMSAGTPPSAPAEVETGADLGWRPRRGHVTLDGYLDAG